MRCRSFLRVCVCCDSAPRPPFLLSRCQTFAFPVFWFQQTFPRMLFLPHLHHFYDTQKSFGFHLYTLHQVSKRSEMLKFLKPTCVFETAASLLYPAQPLVRSSWEQKITLWSEALAFINIPCLALFSLVSSWQDFHITLAVTLWIVWESWAYFFFILSICFGGFVRV